MLGEVQSCSMKREVVELGCGSQYLPKVKIPLVFSSYIYLTHITHKAHINMVVNISKPNFGNKHAGGIKEGNHNIVIYIILILNKFFIVYLIKHVQ